MDDQTTHLPATTTNLGTILDRSLCRQDNEVITKVRILDAGSRRSAYGCSVHTMDNLCESVHQSSLEPDTAHFDQNQAGTTSLGDSGGALLAECSLVPSGTANGDLSSMDVTSSSGTDDLSQDPSSLSTAQLDAIRVATFRQQLLKQNLNAQAVED
ncbi:hypothetical protein MBANPS3_012711, partial [Mucor bainieri]